MKFRNAHTHEVREAPTMLRFPWVLMSAPYAARRPADDDSTYYSPTIDFTTALPDVFSGGGGDFGGGGGSTGDFS